MRKFTNENISKLYISPYLAFCVEGDAVIMWQRVFGCRIRIPECTPPMLESFTMSFRDGLVEEDVKEQLRICFPGYEPEELMMELMRAGVLE